MLRPLLLLACSPALLASSALADTLTVGPTGQFPTIQQAVNAAVDGDRILLEPFDYPESVDIDGKSLTLLGLQKTSHPFRARILADAGGSAAGLTIRNVPVGGAVEVRDLAVLRETGAPGANLVVEDNAGAVWLERVVALSAGGIGLEVDNSADVSILASFAWVVPPLTGFGPFTAPAPGLEVRGASHVQLADSFAWGSDGHFAAPTVQAPLAGGPGLRVVDSVVTVRDGQFLLGGHGGSFDNGFCIEGAPAGPGLEVVDLGGGPAAAVTFIGPTQALVGEPPPLKACSLPVVPPPPIVAPAGSVVELGGVAHKLDFPACVVPANGSLGELHGAPGELYALVYSAAPLAPLALPGITGDLAISFNGIAVAKLGVLVTETAPLAIPALAVPAQAYVQAYLVDGQGGAFLTGPRTLTWL